MNVNVEKVYSFSTDPSTNTITISTNFKYSLGYWVNEPLLLILIHNFITGLMSNGLAMAFGT
jgi:hypothetical protein